GDRHGHELGFGQVVLGEQRLLRKRACGAEIGDPRGALFSGACHQRQDSDAMDEFSLQLLLEDVRSGVLSPDDALLPLRRLPFAARGFARVDHHRALRQGLPEAVYGPGKTTAQCAAIVEELLAEPGSGPVLLTRATDEQAAAAMEANEGGVRAGTVIMWRPAPA